MSDQVVQAWLARILSSDAATFEDAYWEERPSTEIAVPAILRALDNVSDAFGRGKLIELLGESGDMAVLSVLERELLNADETVRGWAEVSIGALKRGEPWQKDPKY